MTLKAFHYSILFLSYFFLATSLPLSTNSRWIVDETGRRVKLACLAWPSHNEAMVAEGLSKQPVDKISLMIASMGFNCVRFSYTLYLATNETVANTTVRESFQSLKLSETIAGAEANNPSIIDLSLIQAFQAVVESLSRNNIRVILDNHNSIPGWCCKVDDRFFGDKFFDPDVWIKGITNMATLFKDTPNVVGISLRNELSGPRQNVNDWYKYMQKGAEVVHAANPNVLVIFSGLSVDTDLRFIQKRQVQLTFTNKTVFNLHRYPGADGRWANSNPNDFCGREMDILKAQVGFVLDQGYPLFVSEWGFDQTGGNENDNRYFNCFMGWFAEFDMEWAYWALPGSYYMVRGKIGHWHPNTILNYNWNGIRNEKSLARMNSIQVPFQGPGINGILETKPHKIIYHPLTGLCILRKAVLGPLSLGPCSDSEAWDYTPNKTLTIKETYFCLQADQLNKPAKMGVLCDNQNTKWDKISKSKMHLSVKFSDTDSTIACLDVDLKNNTLIVNACKCLSKDNKCDPASQWFKLVDSTRRKLSNVY